MIIHANDLEQVKAAIVAYLRNQAVMNSLDARKAVHKRVASVHLTKSDAFAFAASVIEGAKIVPK